MTLRSEDPKATIALLEWAIAHMREILTLPNARERRVEADTVTIAAFKHLKDYLPLELRALVSTILELDAAAWEPVETAPPSSKSPSRHHFRWLRLPWKREQARQHQPRPLPKVSADHHIGQAVIFFLQTEEQDPKDSISLGIVRKILPPNGQHPTCYLISTGPQTVYLVPVHNILS